MAQTVTLYFTPGCGYCVRARGLLDRLGVAFQAINVAGDTAKRQWLREATGQSTVPQIFIGSQSMGGCDELHDLYESGELERLLELPG